MFEVLQYCMISIHLPLILIFLRSFCFANYVPRIDFVKKNENNWPIAAIFNARLKIHSSFYFFFFFKSIIFFLGGMKMGPVQKIIDSLVQEL